MISSLNKIEKKKKRRKKNTKTQKNKSRFLKKSPNTCDQYLYLSDADIHL